MKNSFKCPFTGQEINNEKIGGSSRNGFSTFYYPVLINGEEKYFTFCESFFDKFDRQGSTEFQNEFERIKSIVLYEFINGNLKSKFGGYVMHWDCPNAQGKPDQIVLKDFLSKFENDNSYPKNRKQKTDNLLIYLKNNQIQDGGEIALKDDPGQWGNLFFKNYTEMVFYLEELERMNLIIFYKREQKTRLTFSGLDHLEKSIQINKGAEGKFYEPKYDIALSFAGEERIFVEKVAEELRSQDVKVFYDNYEQADLWGKDLYQHLNDIYRNKCKYCIVFISKSYAEKIWTRHELKSAQARAFKENEEYILPVKFDDTEIPGINLTTGYLEAKLFPPEQIAGMAIKKLRRKES